VSRIKEIKPTGEIHPPMEFERGERYYPDLAIPSGKDPKIIIGCKKLLATSEATLPNCLTHSTIYF
jgi:hypothetical protein